jgi:hypothetical protein
MVGDSPEEVPDMAERSEFAFADRGPCALRVCSTHVSSTE